MPAQNNGLYPANSVQTKLFPTCTLGVVSKFDTAAKYREEEEIVNEDGTLSYVVGVDNTNEADVEIVMFPSQSIPAPLTSVTFTSSGSNTMAYLIRGDVKSGGKAGQARRIAFKCISNASLP